MKKRVLSGITATGSLTIGNYIGAIKNFIKLQDEYEMFIFVADLHALTTEIDPQILSKNRKEIFALYLACGLDIEKVNIFFQSDISYHSEMNWLILTQTNLGELNRMTQFKDKSEGIKVSNQTLMIPTGLLIYPTLMVADILLYNPDIVPVGIDQKQHLELCQNIAKRLNFRFKTNFKIPNAFIPKIGSKIMSLSDPTVKMSKSSKKLNDTIFLLDDPDKAFKKIMSAVTDNENKVYFSNEKPGISNLMTIYASLNNLQISEVERIFYNKNYYEFKLAVATTIKEFLFDIQSKFNFFIDKINDLSIKGAKKASEVAKINYQNLKMKMGLS